MTTIHRNDSFDPADRELEVAFAGDRDLGDHELRRVFPVVGAQIQRVGDSLYPEGYVIDGLTATVPPVTNLLPYSNDFSGWTKVGGAAVTPGFAPDRYGNLGRASLLTGNAGADAYIEFTIPDAASGRKVAAIDVLTDASSQVRLSIFDGESEIAIANFTPSSSWQRLHVAANGGWAAAATDLTFRVRPGTGPLSGSVLIAAAQVEDVGLGVLEPGRYVETTGQSATEPGHRVVLEAGSAYVAGLPRPVAGATLVYDPLKRSGTDLVYVELAERYILAAVTPELTNPVTGRPGNDSVREATQLVKTDTTQAVVPVDPIATNPQYRSRKAVPIYQFDRATGVVTPIAQANKVSLPGTVGALPGVRIAPQSIPEDRLDLTATEGQPGLLAAQARRTRNLGGDFVVPHSGDLPTITQDTAITSVIAMKVDPLDGYTGGKSHYLDLPVVVTTPLQASTALRRGESHTYYTGTLSYALTKTPVQSIAEVTGYYRVSETVVRGPVPGGQDALAKGPVFQILFVQQGATTYANSTDYTQVGDAISWSPAGGTSKEPETGTTYTVTYLYRRTWQASEYSNTASALVFSGAALPEPALPFEVSYNYGQDRVDLVVLGERGVEVLPGTPSDHAVPPAVPQGAMALWEVRVPYLGAAASFTPRFTVGVPMVKLADMQSKIDSLFYNVAQLAAGVDLRNRLGTLKNTITDPFVDARQIDATAAHYTSSGVAVARVDGGRLRPAQTATEQRLTVSATGTTMARRLEWAGLTYAQTASPDASQNAYSGTISVNPFASYDVIPPLLAASMQGWAVQASRTARLVLEGKRFQPDEPGIKILVDGVQVQTVTANSQGAFTLTLDRVIGPTALIQAVGLGGSPSVSIAAPIIWPRRDPAGQSFALPHNADLLGVQLWFSAKDTTKTVLVSLRNMVAGLPTDEIVPGTLVELQPSEVSTTGPTTVLFRVPTPITADRGYTVVAASESGAYVLQFAQLGKINQGPGGGVISKNPYSRGVLMASSDGRTWTPYQDQDLRFAALYAAYEVNTPRVLLLDPVTFPGGIGQFGLDILQTVSTGASCVWEYSINPDDPTPTWTAFAPRNTQGVINIISLGAVATKLRIRATARTTIASAGVAINADNLILTGYAQAAASSYVQRQTVLLSSTTSAKAFVQVETPTGTEVKAYATNNGGTSWVTGTLAATRTLTNGLLEQEWSFTFGSAGTQFRGRLDLQGTALVGPTVEEASFVIQ